MSGYPLGQSTNASERHQLDTFLKYDATIIAACRKETVQRFGYAENFTLWSLACIRAIVPH
jgi:hypothetical protein